MPEITALPDAEFQKKVLEGIEGQQKQIDELKKLTPAEQVLSDQSRWPKELKAVFEDMTKVKTSCNGLDSELKTLERQIKTATRMADLHGRHSFSDPIARFCADEEKRNWINGVARFLAFGRNPGYKLPDHLEKALTGVDSGLGAAVIPTAYIAELYDVLAQFGTYNTLRVDRGLSARTNSYPIMSARPTAVWVGAGSGAAEGTAITAGDFSGTSVSLSIQTAAALLYASREQLADATVDMSSVILRELAESVATLLDNMAFTANATADQVDAGYHGIFDTVAVHSGCTATATSHTSVSATTLDDWLSPLTTVSQRVLAVQSKWWMHPQILAKVCLVRDDNGRPIFQNALEAPSATVGSILGYPVVPTPAAPSTDSTAENIAVFGDPQAYVVGIRQDMELAQSEHIKFAENQIGFRCLVRAGGKHRIPGSNPAAFKPLIVLKLG